MKAGLMLGVNPEAKREANDFYATDPYVINRSIDFFKKIGLSNTVWECACGTDHLSERLQEFGYQVYSSDLINRGYGNTMNFLETETIAKDIDIITNPPFKMASEFVTHAMSILREGQKLVLFLKIQFLETEKRMELFQRCGLKCVGVMSNRVCCAMNGEFDKYFKKDTNGAYKGGTQMYAWYVFEKGYKGQATIDWIK